MKNIETLAYETYQVTTDEVSGSLFLGVLAQAIIDEALGATVAAQLVEENRDMVGSAGKTISFPKETGVSFAAITENASAVVTTPSWTTVDATPTKRGTAVNITNEAIEASRFDIINRTLTILAKAAAQAKDSDVLDALLDRLTDTATFAGDETSTDFTVTAAQIPILAVTEILVTSVTIGVSSYTVDHFDGVIQFASAVPTTATEILVTYEYAQSITAVETDTAGVLDYAAVINAKVEVDGANYEADSLLVHPNEMGDLVKLQQFYDVSQYGSAEVINRGEVGKLGGLKTYVSSNVPEGVSIVLDSKAAGVLAVKRDLTVKFDEDIYADHRIVVATEMYDAVLVNSAAVCLIVGAQSNDQRQ